LRVDLQELARRVPGMLDRLDQLPQALPQGEPARRICSSRPPNRTPWSRLTWRSIARSPWGSTSPSLLVGVVHAQQLPAADLPTLHRVLPAAYQQGMTAEPASLADVRSGYIGSMVVRAAFTSLLFGEPLSSLTDEYFDQRVALTRFIADLGLEQST